MSRESSARRSPVVRWILASHDTAYTAWRFAFLRRFRPSPGLTRLNFQEVVVWPSHVRLSIHPPPAAARAGHQATRRFCTRHTRAHEGRRPFFFLLSASIFNSWPFMHSLLVDALPRDCFARRPIDWLARIIHALTTYSSFHQACRWIVSSNFGRAPSPHLALSVSDIRRRRRKSKEIE